MRVLAQNILVEKIADTSEESTILIQPDRKEERMGVVRGLSEELKSFVQTPILKIGDVICYKEFITGQEFSKNGKDYIVMQYHDVVYIDN